MRHYQLIPVRYNDQQLLVCCEPIDAELWSIQWRTYSDMPSHWFADCAPLEQQTAQNIVDWLNAYEQMKATPGIYAVESRSKP